jgi:hypothetical protein
MAKTKEQGHAGRLEEVAAVCVVHRLRLSSLAGDFRIKLNDGVVTGVVLIPDAVVALTRRFVVLCGYEAAHLRAGR